MTSSNTPKRVVIKIGSSSLTSRHGEISRRKLEKLTDEIALMKDEGHEIILVSSGAVAAGYRKLGCLNRPSSLPEKQAAASIGQGLLMEAYSELFLSHGYVASQILITRSDFSDEKRYKNVRNTINVLLDRGIIPIVNENDTVTVDRLKFGDNDTLSAKVAGLVDAEKLIILSDIDGLYNSDPRKDSKARLLENVYEITPEIEAAAGDSGSTVGTGGMKSKIEAVKIAMASGITTFLGKAGVPFILIDAVNHRAKGTYFKAENNMINLDHKKKWIAFNSGPEGKIVINEQAKNTLVKSKQNLTPSGIKQISGYFNQGAVIRVLTEDEVEIGLGVIRCSSKELLEFKGQEMLRHDDIDVMLIEDFVCHLDVSMSVGI